MKNNIKKISVKFWVDLLYFEHFMQMFVFAQIRDYNHLNVLVILGENYHLTSCRWVFENNERGNNFFHEGSF